MEDGRGGLVGGRSINRSPRWGFGGSTRGALREDVMEPLSWEWRLLRVNFAFVLVLVLVLDFRLVFRGRARGRGRGRNRFWALVSITQGSPALSESGDGV